MFYIHVFYAYIPLNFYHLTAFKQFQQPFSPRKICFTILDLFCFADFNHVQSHLKKEIKKTLMIVHNAEIFKT